MSQSTYDIVIIGAGLAGLAAGQRLRQAGVTPLVLEARERLGGRIWTDHTHGPVELGAEFIHGEKASIWELIKSCRIKTESWPQKKGLNTKRLYAWSGQLVTDPPDFSG
ncbi:MAG TPA: FAD-dependent oxidoreductase, partial [Anaerolineae bacterium]|nr:FAD-dependent oxidoreductase [Anaerolineae bacterium]